MSTNSHPIQIAEYKPPRGLGVVVFSGVLLNVACFVGLPWLVPSSLPWRLLENGFPGGPTRFQSIIKISFWSLTAIHSLEVIAFDRTRMVRHGVRRWSSLWWKWILTCWVEGFTCWQRIDAMIAAKAEKKKD